MRFRTLITVHAISGLLAAAPALAQKAVAAATCADRLVQARGEPSRFEALAKTAARGNWRAQVRAMPDLGPPYANWNKAQDADYSCSQGDGGYTCTAIGRPCRN